VNRPLATISVDVDPVDLHLMGYGFKGLPADPLAMACALPRLLELFARCGVRATLFVVGRDAEAHGEVLRKAVAAGHEIASHTSTHPMRFAGLTEKRKRRELVESKAVLEQTSGAKVVGFRAPNFDMASRVLPLLAEAGYRYDASAYPTPVLLASRAVLAMKSAHPPSVLAMKPWPFTWKRQPYDWTARGVTIREFPLAVTPGLRLPVYHTLRYFTNERRFLQQLDQFVARGEQFSYCLHAVDALGASEDHVDARLGKHPGMDRRLDAKLALLETSLRAIAARFDVRPYAEQLG
jgi:peptidoglycan/xylan/chitin deacetylase (PgdA/CDA1 family)